MFHDLRALVWFCRCDGDEQMFGGDVFVAHLLHFLARLRKRGGQLPADLRLRGGRSAGARQRVLCLVHGCADVLRVATRGFDQSANHAVFLTQQSVKQVQGFDLRVACGRRVLHGVGNGFLRHCGELLFHIILHGSRRTSVFARLRRRICRYLICSTNFTTILFPKVESATLNFCSLNEKSRKTRKAATHER